MPEESNAGMRRSDSGLMSAMSSMTLGHQSRHSEYLVGYFPQRLFEHLGC